MSSNQSLKSSFWSPIRESPAQPQTVSVLKSIQGPPSTPFHSQAKRQETHNVLLFLFYLLALVLCCCHTSLTLTSLRGFQIQEETTIYRLSPTGKTGKRGVGTEKMGRKWETGKKQRREYQVRESEGERTTANIKESLKKKKKICPLVLSGPLARLNKQPMLQRDTLTVTALDLAEFRVLSARLINTSFSFNGAGASPQPSKVPFIWVIYGSSSRSTRGTVDPVHISVC